MALLSSRRAIVLAALVALALLLGFSLVASLAAPAVRASEISVSNLVIRSITLACVLTRRSFAMSFISIAKPPRSPSSPSQAAVLMAG